MHSLGSKLLARAALPNEHDRGRGRRHTAELVIQHLHTRRAAQDAAETAKLTQLLAQLADLMLQSGSFLGVPQHSLNTVEIRRFDEIVARAGAKRRNSAINCGMARDNDDFGGLRLVELTHKLDTLAVRQAKVRQKHVRALPPKLNARVPDTVGAGNGKPLHAC